MSDLSIAELEDKQDTVYVVGVSSDQAESVRAWMHTEFEHEFNKCFAHAEVLVVPGMTGITEVQETTKSDLEAMLESVQEPNVDPSELPDDVGVSMEKDVRPDSKE